MFASYYISEFGLYTGGNNEIEDKWNDRHTRETGKDLNVQGLTEMQVHKYLSETPVLGERGFFFSPTTFEDENDARIAEDRVRTDFMQAPAPAGMIIGVEHATVLYKQNGEYIFFYPDQLDSSYIARYENLSLNRGRRSDGNWEIRFTNNREGFSGNYVMVIR